MLRRVFNMVGRVTFGSICGDIKIREPIGYGGYATIYAGIRNESIITFRGGSRRYGVGIVLPPEFIISAER